MNITYKKITFGETWNQNMNQISTIMYVLSIPYYNNNGMYLNFSHPIFKQTYKFHCKFIFTASVASI